MRERGGELVTTDEPAVDSEPLLDAIVVEGSQSDGCFPDAPCTNESDWSEGFGEVGDLLDQLIASKTGPWRRGRKFTGWTGYKT